MSKEIKSISYAVMINEKYVSGVQTNIAPYYGSENCNINYDIGRCVGQ